MELWIRSQDKMLLEKVQTLKVAQYINKNFNEVDFTFGIVVNNDYVFGDYTTKERALEVLDEIQNILKPIIHLTREKIDYTKPYVQTEQIGSKSMIQELSTYVYEMPKE